MFNIHTGQCLKVLVAYYSYSGNTKIVAQSLRERTCGVLCELETRKQYSKRTVVIESKQELEQKNLPDLKHAVPCMASYDLIFVGGPVWCYTVASPVMTFLREANFAGKRVAAFCTHEGGVGSYFQDFRQQAENATILEGLELYTPRGWNIAELDQPINDWFRKMEISACIV